MPMWNDTMQPAADCIMPQTSVCLETLTTFALCVCSMACCAAAAASGTLSVLRTARLLRVFKLARSWSELNRIITTILKSFSQVMYLSLLLMLFVFVFALMGEPPSQQSICRRARVCTAAPIAHGWGCGW